MAEYEYYRGSQMVERVRAIPGEYEDTRIGLLVMERTEAGDRDGWYAAGTYQPGPVATSTPDPAGLPVTRLSSRRNAAAGE